MSYQARFETQNSRPIALPAAIERGAAKPDFSPLEWSVIRLARVDGMWTIRTAGRLGRLWNWFLGRINPVLANARLEALRKMAVLSWHFGFTVPGDDVSDFLCAGFTPDQYELMVRSISAAIRNPQKKASV